MKELYTKKIRIGSSMCDERARLSVPAAFRICMDAATEHAQFLGIGFDYMVSRNCYWITAKTRIHFNSFPRILEEVSVCTWPLKPKAASCIRDYRIESADGKELLCGKTEWVMRDNNSGWLLRGKDIFPEDMLFSTETVLEEPFAEPVQPTDSFRKLGEYTVVSNDIDIGQHMNNTAYIDAFFRMLSTEEIQKRGYSDVEILYRKQCFEGDRITFFELYEPGKTAVAVMNADGEEVASIRLK